jgi:competence protein CoiA
LKSNAPFFCPECGDEVALKTGTTKVNYFAHKTPLACRFDENESNAHRQCKLEIYQALPLLCFFSLLLYNLIT